MNIKVGQYVEVRMNGYTREGKIEEIWIGTNAHDPAGESGVKCESYETDLKYQGSIVYGKGYWAYFDQIMEVTSAD